MLDISDIVSGGTPNTNLETNFEVNGIPWITPSDLTNYSELSIMHGRRSLSQQGFERSSAQLIPKGSVLFSSRAPIGYSVIAGQELTTNQGFKSFILGNGIDALYVRAYLEASKEYAESLASGTTFLELSAKNAGKLLIPIPPREEQKRISEILVATIGRLSLSQSALRNAEDQCAELRQALLRQGCLGELTRGWRSKKENIGDIEETLSAVSAPIQPKGGRKPTDQVIDGRAGLSVGKPTKPAPEGWKWVSLLRVARQETGHTPSRSNPDWWNGDVNWVGIQDAREHHGTSIFKTRQLTNSDGIANSAARLLPKGTVCLSRTASVGYVTIMGREMATSQDFATWTCTPALLPEFLMYSFMAEGSDLVRFGKGTTHTTIYFPELRALHICLPPIGEQKRIVSVLEDILDQLASIESLANSGLDLIAGTIEQIQNDAFRGELSYQDRNDVPAADVLSQIVLERKNRVKTTKSRMGKAVTRITKNREILSVASILDKQTSSISAQDLLTLTGHPKNVRTSELDDFFLQLRDLLTKGKITRDRVRNEDFFQKKKDTAG